MVHLGREPSPGVGPFSKHDSSARSAEVQDDREIFQDLVRQFCVREELQQWLYHFSCYTHTSILDLVLDAQIMPLYSVRTPEYSYIDVILDDGTGPTEWACDSWMVDAATSKIAMWACHKSSLLTYDHKDHGRHPLTGYQALKITQEVLDKMNGVLDKMNGETREEDTLDQARGWLGKKHYINALREQDLE